MRTILVGLYIYNKLTNCLFICHVKKNITFKWLNIAHRGPKAYDLNFSIYFC